MEITRKSIISGKTQTLDLPVTAEQVAAFDGGALIQNAFPHLTCDQREFILTGVTAEEWAGVMFAEEADDDNGVDADEAAF